MQKSNVWRYECGCAVQGSYDRLRPECQWHGKPIRVPTDRSESDD